MNEDVYELLLNIGLNKTEINNIEDNNQDVFLLSCNHLRMIINSLIKLGFSYKEIRYSFIANSYILTITTNNLNDILLLFKKYNFSKEEMLSFFCLKIDFNCIDYYLINETNADNINRYLKKYIKNKKKF